MGLDAVYFEGLGRFVYLWDTGETGATTKLGIETDERVSEGEEALEETTNGVTAQEVLLETDDDERNLADAAWLSVQTAIM